MDTLNSITSVSGTKDSDEIIKPPSPKKPKLSKEVNDSNGQSTTFTFEKKYDDGKTSENKDSQTSIEIIELLDENMQKEAKLDENNALDEESMANNKKDTSKNCELTTANHNKDPDSEKSKKIDIVKITNDEINKNKDESNIDQNIIEIDSDDDEYNNEMSNVDEDLKMKTDEFDTSDVEIIDFSNEKDNSEKEEDHKKSLSTKNNLETNKKNSESTTEVIIIIEENDPETEEADKSNEKNDELQKLKEKIEAEIKIYDDELRENISKKENDNKKSSSVDEINLETNKNSKSTDEEIIVIEENDPESGEADKNNEKNDESQNNIPEKQIEIIGNNEHDDNELQNNISKEENDDKKSSSVDENNLERNKKNSEPTDQEVIVIEENDPDSETETNDDKSQNNNCTIAEDCEIKDKESSSEKQISESNTDYETNEIITEKNLSSSDDKNEQKIDEKEAINDDENEKIDHLDSTNNEKNNIKIDKIGSGGSDLKIIDSFTLNTDDNDQDIEFNEDENYLNVNNLNNDNDLGDNENTLELDDDIVMADEDNNCEKTTDNEIKENEKDNDKNNSNSIDDVFEDENNKCEDDKKNTSDNNNLEPQLMAMSERQVEENDTGYQMEIDDYEEEDIEVIEIFDDDEEEEDNDDNEVTITETDLSSLSNSKSMDDIKKDESENQEINEHEEMYAGLELFYNKDCINAECNKKSKIFVKASTFSMKLFRKPPKTKVKRKIHYCCKDCNDLSLKKHKNLCSNLLNSQCILNEELPRRHEIVEILDSSDEEDSEDYNNDNHTLDERAHDFINENLDDTIHRMMKLVNVKYQMKLMDQKFQFVFGKIEDDLNHDTNRLNEFQSNANEIYHGLYSNYTPRIKELPPLDLNIDEDDLSWLPPEGEVSFPPIELHQYYYTTEKNLIDKWSLCKITEISNLKSMKYYKVEFENVQILEPLFVSPKQLAYFNPPSVRLPVGSRVIALFDSKKINNKMKYPSKNEYYPGIIAETMTANNRYRYLVFFDDGYPQYISHKNIRLVCHSSKEVWNDVYSNCREFFRTYLTESEKDRPILEVKKGQALMIEINNMWFWAKALEVDCSIVLMQTASKSRLEWFYRGSTRLYPVYKEKFQQKKPIRMSQLARRTEQPYIRYMQESGTSMSNSNKNLIKSSSEFLVPSIPVNNNRSVAKKSVSKDSVSVGQSQQQQWQQHHQSPSQPVKHLNNSTIFLEDDNKPKGKIIYYAAKNISSKKFIQHVCEPSCLHQEYNLKLYSPLIKPLLSGWERLIYRAKLKKWVVYRGPCGRLLRNMKEVHQYLRITQNILNVDNFDFDPTINVMAQYSVEECFVEKMVEDISEGIENMPVPCINYYDDTVPPNCTYSTERIPTEGVFLNLDPEFLVGCDCTDDCSDKTKCSCWQLTLDGAKFNNTNVPSDKIGYSYMRLPEPVPTGIYECNHRCKCSKKCLNRVVQHPLQMKLQVFKTSNRGWGLRCINDIPKGSFICIYAGHLLTEQNANEGGANFGDEYFAELDYIEVVERLKEGYESDVQEDVDSDDEVEEKNQCNDSDEEFRSHSKIQAKTPSVHTRMQARIEKEKKTNDDNDNEDENEGDRRKVLNYDANKNTTLDKNGENTTKKYKTVRKFFGKNEYCYVMDAKLTGNIGRYFNHSCSPNLFVQNVFVDTHDLRFPWVAFFALHNIRAGTELTWNYNYEVGVVPGKVLYCECGSENCRGRLL